MPGNEIVRDPTEVRYVVEGPYYVLHYWADIRSDCCVTVTHIGRDSGRAEMTLEQIRDLFECASQVWSTRDQHAQFDLAHDARRLLTHVLLRVSEADGYTLDAMAGEWVKQIERAY